jgi:hypothetical protein
VNYLFDKNLFLKELKKQTFKLTLAVTKVKFAVWFFIINYSIKSLNVYVIKRLVENGNTNTIHTYGIYNIIIEQLMYVLLLVYGLLLILRIYIIQKNN